MIRLDRIKLSIGSDAITGIDTDRMKLNQETIPGNGVLLSEELSTVNSPGIGIKRIRYDKIKQEAIIEVSGKVLRDQYFELINKNTIERVFSEINKCSPVTFDPGKAIDTAMVLTMDCTDNLKVSNDPADYLTALNQIRIDERYNLTKYKEPGNKGLVITGKQKSFKERQIFYIKLLDLYRDKVLNNEWYYQQLIREHSNVLRVESNLMSFAKIREYAGGSTKLKEILASQERPNLMLFEKITKRNVDFQLYLELQTGKYAGMTLHKLEKQKGMEEIIRECNYDINLIIQIINQVRGQGSNNSKVVRLYRNELAGLIQDEGLKTVRKNELIEEIRYLLAA